MEKESNRGLRLQVRPDLSSSVTHARLPHRKAPQRTRGSLFLVFRRSRSQPTTYFQALQAGKLASNACLIRRTHQAMKSCPASVATASPHLEAESCPILPAVGTGSHPLES